MRRRTPKSSASIPTRSSRVSGIILASASPRRRELLAAAGVTFRVVPSAALEEHTSEHGPEYLVRENARRKAEAVAAVEDATLVIGADTVVVLDGRVLGKPADMREAERMVRSLQGREHAVLTGLAVVDLEQGEIAVTVEETIVRFAPLSDAELHAYLAAFDPLDKAGAYAIQGPGALVIEEVRGCYYNVVGLPLRALERLCNGLGRSLLQEPSRRRRAPQATKKDEHGEIRPGA